MSHTNDNLKLLHFIKYNREQDIKKNKDKPKLYKPKERCGDGMNYINSDYVYMRSRLNLSSGIFGIGSDSANIIETNDYETCNKTGLDIPCIGLKKINDIIKDDNTLLEGWIKEIKTELDNKVSDTNYQESSDKSNYNTQYNKDYTPEFLTEVQNVLGAYKFEYKKESFYDVPNGCNVPIRMSKFAEQYETEINKIIKDGKLDIAQKFADLNFLPDLGSYGYDESAPLDNAELQEGKDLLKTIIQQISSIEMKSQMNKTKIKTLIGQYGILKKIRQSVNKRVGAMQRRIDDLNRIRGQNDQEIEDLQSKIRRLRMSRDNLKREIQDVVRQSDITAAEKNRRVNQLNNAKNDLDNENYKLKQDISRLKNNKHMIEQKNTEFQKDLEKAKSELGNAEDELKTVSKKLNKMNIDAEKQKINEKELLSKSELKEIKKDFEPLPSAKSIREELPSKSELVYDDEESPVLRRKKRRPGRPRKSAKRKSAKRKSSSRGTSVRVSVRRKSRKKRKPRTRASRVDDLSLFEDDTPSIKPKPKPKPRKKRKPRSRASRVDSLSLFDDEESMSVKPKPKRKRKSRKKSSKIKVKVKRRRRRKKDDEDDDDDEEIFFNFSLRNLM